MTTFVAQTRNIIFEVAQSFALGALVMPLRGYLAEPAGQTVM